MVAITVGDIVEVRQFPGQRWVVIRPHDHGLPVGRLWRVRRALQGRTVGDSDLTLIDHPQFEPGQVVSYFGNEAEVLRDDGDTVRLRYLHLRPRNLDRLIGRAWREPAVRVGETDIDRGELVAQQLYERENLLMDDKEYKATRLRASICPGMETRWEKPETSHWIALHKFGNELRGSVGKTMAALEAVEGDKALSPEGKREKKLALATKALNELETGTSLVKARESVAAQMKKWADKVSANVKPAADQAEAVLHAQIREKVGGMKEGRMAFLQKHGTDPTVASALLEAPAFLSGLSEAELALLRTEVEKKFLSPEIIESKGKVNDALLECERSLRAGMNMIRQGAGVEKPSSAEIAMARAKVA